MTKTLDPSLDERWVMALGLAEIRGWQVFHNVTDCSMSVRAVGERPEDVYIQTYVKTEECLQGLLALMQNGLPQARYNFGYTDPRTLYGHTVP